MAETLTLAQEPEAPVDLNAIRSRFEQLPRRRRDDSEVSESDLKSVGDLGSEYQVALEKVDARDSSASAFGSGDLDACIEWLKKEISLVEEANWKVSAEVGGRTEIEAKDMVRLDAGLEALQYSLKAIDSKGRGCLERNPIDGVLILNDSCGNQVHAVKDCNFEVLELDHQMGKSETNLKVFENLNSSLRRAAVIGQIQSMLLLSETKGVEFKNNCLRLFLKVPILTFDGLSYGEKLDCVVETLILDHELLIEATEGSMELKKVEIFPDDVCLDGLVDRVKSSREVISVLSLGWFIRQVQHHITINILRRSLVKDANKSRHSFEYSDKDETVIVHLVGGIDAFIKISVDWPLSSSGLKLISIRSSGVQLKNISLSLLCKTKELANGMDLQTRAHLVRFVDAIEEILVREMQSELHSGSVSG